MNTIPKRYRASISSQTAARLAEIAQHYEVMKGTCGRVRRDSEGQAVGRNRGYKATFPEMKKVPYAPAAITAAIRRGEGVIFRRIQSAVVAHLREELQRHLSAIANKSWATRRQLVQWGASSDGRTAALKAWATRRKKMEVTQ